VKLPDRPVSGAFAALLSASEQPSFTKRVAFPSLTDVFGPDGPPAYAQIDAALLGALRPPATARAAGATTGTVGSVSWNADGASAQTGGKANGPMTDTGGFSDTATDTDNSQHGERKTTWRVNIERPCPNQHGVVHGAAVGDTRRSVTIVTGRGKTKTYTARVLVTSSVDGYVRDDARLVQVVLDGDVVLTGGSGGSWNGGFEATVGPAGARLELTGPDAADLSLDGAAKVLSGLLAAAAERLLHRAEQIWRTPNRCAKLGLTASPGTIAKGQTAKVRARSRAANGVEVSQGLVKATPSGATVDPRSDRTDADGIAKFTVKATTDSAALSTHLTSRAGIATAAIHLGKGSEFSATLEADRTATWTFHVTRFNPDGNCNVDGQGVEHIRTPPEGFVASGVGYSDRQNSLIGGFGGYLVLNRDATYTDSCSTTESTSGCGVDRPFDKVTFLNLENDGGYLDVTAPPTTDLPRTDCPDFGGPFCDGPDPGVVDHPAKLPRAQLRDPKVKVITLQGSTTSTIDNHCEEPGSSSTTERYEVTFTWKIVLRRQ